MKIQVTYVNWTFLAKLARLQWLAAARQEGDRARREAALLDQARSPRLYSFEYIADQRGWKR